MLVFETRGETAEAHLRTDAPHEVRALIVRAVATEDPAHRCLRIPADEAALGEQVDVGDVVEQHAERIEARFIEPEIAAASILSHFAEIDVAQLDAEPVERAQADDELECRVLAV